MSVIRRLLPQRFDDPPEADESRSSYARIDWSDILAVTGGGTSSGVPVTPESAARSAAVTACQRVLTSSVASLPVDVIRERRGNRRERLTSQPEIVRSPSGTVRRRVFVAQWMKSLLNDGNIYSDIVAWDANGNPRQMETRHYGDIRWRKGDDDRLRPYDNMTPLDLWPVGTLLHIPSSPFAQPGTPVADSPVELAKEAIGTGLAAERFGGRFFTDGGRGSDIVYMDHDPGKEQAEEVKRQIMASRTGLREPAVVGSGVTVEHEVIDPNDSQFIDLLRFEVEQACRFFGVPPSMAYAAVSGQNVTYTNATMDDLQYLKHSLQIWLLDLEDAWSELIPAPQQVKFNVDGLLRMDSKARHQIHDTRLKNRTTSVNEVRELEDEEPFDDPAFDEPGIPGEGGDSREASEVSQDVYLAYVNGVLTRSEARQLIANAGADIDPDAMPELADPPSGTEEDDT